MYFYLTKNLFTKNIFNLFDTYYLTFLEKVLIIK